MPLDEIWKREASPLGPQHHGNVKFFCNTALVSILQLPGGEKVLAGEAAARLHHQFTEGLAVHWRQKWKAEAALSQDCSLTNVF